jgi:hypothetical protein
MCSASSTARPKPEEASCAITNAVTMVRRFPPPPPWSFSTTEGLSAKLTAGTAGKARWTSASNPSWATFSRSRAKSRTRSRRGCGSPSPSARRSSGCRSREAHERPSGSRRPRAVSRSRRRGVAAPQGNAHRRALEAGLSKSQLPSALHSRRSRTSKPSSKLLPCGFG